MFVATVGYQALSIRVWPVWVLAESWRQSDIEKRQIVA